MDVPTTRTPAAGVTSRNATGDGITVIVAVAVFPSTVQLATALPTCCAAIAPLAPIVATVGSEIVHEREVETTTPRESRATQLSGAIEPSSSVAVDGDIWIVLARPSPTPVTEPCTPAPDPPPSLQPNATATERLRRGTTASRGLLSRSITVPAD